MKLLNFLILALIVIFASAFVSGADLTAQKLVEESSLVTGGQATVLIRFSNPFGIELPLKIVDKNIIGNNGLDVQCLEYALPKDSVTVVGYEPIHLFGEGNFVLDKAKISFTNPQTGKEETVESNNLTVTVSKGNSTGKSQGITTLYQCNGQQIQSTSYSSSGSSVNIQTSSGGQQNNQQQANQNQQAGQDPNSAAVQNNQQAQDTQAIQRQLQKQSQIADQFKNNVAQSPAVQNMQKQLAEQNFSFNDSNYDPKDEKNGNFEMTYQRNGTTATLKGTMLNGTVSNISKSVKNLPKKSSVNFWYLVLVVPLVALLYLILRKKPAAKSEEQIIDSKVDIEGIARQMLHEAQKLFDQNKKKQAYTLVSEAVRHYYRYHLNTKELTNQELVTFLNKGKLPFEQVQKCLNLCGLVEFAKYEPNKEDFKTIIEIANSEIVATHLHKLPKP